MYRCLFQVLSKEVGKQVFVGDFLKNETEQFLILGEGIADKAVCILYDNNKVSFTNNGKSIFQ